MPITEILSPLQLKQSNELINVVLPTDGLTVFEFESESTGVQGSPEIISIHVNIHTQITDGYSLNIGGYVFTFNSVPTRAQCPCYPSSQESIMRKLEYILSRNSGLNSTYDISFSDNTVYLKARNNIPTNLVISQDANAFLIQSVNAVPSCFAETVSDYSMIMVVYVCEVDDEYVSTRFLQPTAVDPALVPLNRHINITKDFDGSNRFRFDMTMLSELVSNDPPRFNSADTVLTPYHKLCRNMVRMIVLDLYESYTSSNGHVLNFHARYGCGSYDLNLWIVKSWAENRVDTLASQADFRRFWARRDGETLIPIKFLTDCYQDKHIYFDSIEYLYFVWDRVNQDTTTLQIRIGLEYEDCLFEEINLPTINEWETDSWGNIVEIEVSPRVFNYESDLLSGLARYSVTVYEYDFLNNTYNQLTEPFRYELDQSTEKYLSRFQLIFRNKRGGYDSLRPSGTSETDVNINLETFGMTRKYSDEQYFERSLQGTLIESSNTFSLNHICFSLDEVNWLLETLSKSTDVYILDSLGEFGFDFYTEPKPCIINNIKYNETSEGLAYSVEISGTLKQS